MFSGFVFVSRICCIRLTEFLLHASEVLFLALSVISFSLSLKYLWNGQTDLHQIHREDVFDSSLE